MGIRGCGRPVAVISVFFFLAISSRAQETFFPGLSGEALTDALRAEFTPDVLLTESQVKDTLYTRIFMFDDSVRCVYSGMARNIPPGADPSQWLYGAGTETLSMNLEHSWPQAKGAGDGTMGNRDMHHLFPSRSQINSTRANHPYQEIPDEETKTWYYRQQTLSNKPAGDITLYSEFASGRFEPRESVKGDIARAMFYFWTIYRDDAIAADPNFFALQREAFCAWHMADPVDDEEMARSQRIAGYQGGVANPFVLDCSLVERAYCQENEPCLSTANTEVREVLDVLSFDPAERAIRISESVSTTWLVRVYDLSGRMVHACTVGPNSDCALPDMVSGLYVVLAASREGMSRLTFFLP
jgi:hypothetical protein